MVDNQEESKDDNVLESRRDRSRLQSKVKQRRVGGMVHDTMVIRAKLEAHRTW